MARELINIGNNKGGLFFPGTSANPFTIGNTCTCDRTLERAENQSDSILGVILFYKVKPYPKKTESLF
ncbi:hypothetical protein SDC9_118922 [bioreactor metagenome]|uniref:Uncharacterized protein n=1 Tax=bioreactor metagenome TaxID=1076179 RepID=A0A645C2F0_9ZZZZ